MWWLDELIDLMWILVFLSNLYFIKNDLFSIKCVVERNERNLKEIEDYVKKLSSPIYNFNPNVFDYGIDTILVTFGELLIPSNCLYRVPVLDDLNIECDGSVKLKFIFRYDENVYDELRKFKNKSKACKLYMDNVKVGYWGSIQSASIVDTAYAGKLIFVSVELNSAFYEEEK